MSYSYWCMTILVILLLLLLLRKSMVIMRRPLHTAWKIALIRAIFPIRVSSLSSIYNWINPQLGIAETPLVKVDCSDVSSAEVSSMASTYITANIIQILIFVGLLLFFIQCIVIALRSYKIFKSSMTCEKKSVVEWANARSAKWRKIKVLVSNDISIPISCSFGIHAFIIVPPNFDYSEKTHYIFEHEFIHIKHHDSFWKMLACLVRCIHWFNPIVWIMIYFFNLDLEMACDEDVLKKYGHEFRSHYAKILVDFGKTLSAPLPELFATFLVKKSIKERIVGIMKFSGISNKKIVLSIGAVLICTFCFATNSFVSANTRQPMVPDPPMGMVPDEENHLVKLQTIEPSYFTFSAINGKVPEHDVGRNEIYIYDNDGKSWSFGEGDNIEITLRMVDRGFDHGQKTEMGYYVNGEEHKILSEQIKSGAKMSFTAPVSGEYNFFVSCRSSDTILIEYIEIQIIG